MTDRQERHKEKRKQLKELSKIARMRIAEDCEGMSVNEVLVDVFYKDEINRDFKTLHQWSNEGFKVKKGSKAFLLWGKPKPIEKEKPEQAPADSEQDEEDFFPLCYLFSNNQVEKR